MNVETITMSHEDAVVALQTYEKYLRRRKDRDPELEAVVTGYRAVAAGQAILNLPHVIGSAGWREDGWPVLAVARADCRQVRCRVNGDSVQFFVDFSWRSPDYRKRARTSIYVPRQRFPSRPRLANLRDDAQTIVPLVPPTARKLAKGGLAHHFVLWEVEEWQPVPPVDPMLIRPLGGDLYVVVAAWNLTEVERAVIAGSRSDA